MSTLEGLERIPAPTLTPDQWTTARTRLETEAPDLVGVLIPEEYL